MKPKITADKTPEGAFAAVELDGKTWACQLTRLPDNSGAMVEIRCEGRACNVIPATGGLGLMQAAIRAYRQPVSPRTPMDLKASTGREG